MMPNKQKPDKNQKKQKKEEQEVKRQERKKLREKFAELLELPKEVVLNIPKITIVGGSDMIVENYRGVVECENARIRLNTGVGVLGIRGTGLKIREITSEDVIISGNIQSLEFNK
jgi:sporulation protein YqfC